MGIETQAGSAQERPDREGCSARRLPLGDGFVHCFLRRCVAGFRVRRADAPWTGRRSHARRMLLPRGCVQPSLAPEIDAATVRVLDALQIEAVTPKAACCGALRHHLGDDALDEIRHTIDAWWPHVDSGVEAIVMNASGCAAMVKEYAYLLRHDSRLCVKGSPHRRADARSGGTAAGACPATCAASPAA